MTLEESVQKFINEKTAYFEQWIFDEPIVIGKSHNNDLQKVQKILYKLIQEFVTNYTSYKHFMPMQKEVNRIIDIFNEKEYKVGTYRTDFVYDSKNQVKLIEITCRFAMNGMFLSALMNNHANKNKHKAIENAPTTDIYTPIYNHLRNYLGKATSVYILKGSDVKNESKIYKDIFNRMNLEVIEINNKEIDKYKNQMLNSLIISELSFDEILEISEENIKLLSTLNLINDFRTIFLIHDKRFFSVIGKKELQENILTKEEILFFSKYYIPCYNSNEGHSHWEEAKRNKNNWIIKHRALGKSQQIYAGPVTEQKEWNALFEKQDLTDMVLQQWIPQKRVHGTIKGEPFHDYLTGTLLFFDDNYFGFGDFRSSSFPVTNKVDHRKFSSVILQEDSNLLKATNYIK